MVITKSEDVTKQDFCKIPWRKLRLREGLLLSLNWVCVGWGGRLLSFSAHRMGAYSRWAPIRGWALIRINTVYAPLLSDLREGRVGRYLTIIPRARMGSDSIAHEGETNDCFSKIQVVGQKYWDKTTLASKIRFSRHCFGFQSRRFSLLVDYNI